MTQVDYTPITAHQVPKVVLPISKSIMNRELMLLGDRVQDVTYNSSWPKDIQYMLHALRSSEGTLDLGPAGTAMRFATAYHSIGQGSVTLCGTDRMHDRPIKDLVEALRCIGADIQYMGKEGYPPLRISPAKLAASPISIAGSTSSQFISALLLIAHRCPDGMHLELIPPLVSKPYIDLTIAVMKKAGILVEWQGNIIKVEPREVDPTYELCLEADWSAAAFFYGMVALGSPQRLILQGLRKDSMQGDKSAMDYFRQLGVESRFTPEGVEIWHTGTNPKSFAADFVDHPDLAQAIAITCAGLGIQCELRGLRTLRIKETDRIAALEQTLELIGITAESGDDHLTFHGRMHKPNQIELHGYDDHRMVMSYAILSSRLESMRIVGAECVEKSFPDFWQEMQKLGVHIRTASGSAF